MTDASGLAVGQSAELEKEITAGDVEAYARITGDFNPVHMDEEFARGTRFGGRIAHGMLSAGLISAALATKLPGPGAIYLGQTLRFTKPVRVGDTVTVRVEVLEVTPEKRRARLSTVCRNGSGDTVLEGEATVMLVE